MATQTFTAFTPEIWSPRVNFFFEQKLIVAPLFLDFSDDVVDGGDIVHVPNIADSFTASDITVTTGAVTSANLSDTNTNLTVNKWKGAAYDLTDFQWAQVLKSMNIKDGYARAIGYRLARQFEVDLLAELNNLDASVGNTSTSLLSTTLEKAFGILTSNSIPRDESVLLIHPKIYWNDIMSITKYSDASQFGKPSVPKGFHDMLYGVPVLLTPNTPTPATGGFSAAVVHRRALMYAFANLPNSIQRGVRLQEKESENLKKKIVGDIAYGVGTLNSGAGVQIFAAGN